MKIIVRTPNWLGDCIMALPVFRELKKAYPSAHIAAACRSNLQDCFCASPDIDEVITVPPSGGGIEGFKKLYQSALALREEEFNAGVLLTNSFSSALWLWLTKINKRIGFARDLRSLLLNCPFKVTEDIAAAHQGQYYLQLLNCFGVEANMSNPVLFVPEKGQQEAQAALQSLGIPESGKYAVIAPFSAYGPVKDWPKEYYADIAAMITKKTGMQVLITGTPAQKAECQSIAEGIDGVFPAAGLTGLSGFLGLLKNADLFVGGDSGGAHSAAALNIPTVSIFGITEPSRTRALGEKVAIIGKGGMQTPNLRDPKVARMAREALESIAPEEVFLAAMELVSNL